MKQKNNPRILNAWAFYDWANSVYNLSITTAIFPIYFYAVTKTAFDETLGTDMVEFFGFTIQNTALYSYCYSFSFLIIAILSPILSGIADYSGRKKFFMQVFTYLGSFSCIGLYFFDGKNLEYGMICFILASVGYAGALVFYNGFLPEIATKDRHDSISARGYSLGYIGSVILLVISLGLITNPDLIFDVAAKTQEFIAQGKTAEDALKAAEGFYSSSMTKISFLLVGFWWMGFAQVSFFILKDNRNSNKIERKELLTKGIKELIKVLNYIKTQHALKGFLGSFFFYSMGVQTIMALAPLFGTAEIKMADDQMIILVLLLQVIAVPGAYLFAWISRVRGNKVSIVIMLTLWVGICIGAYNTYTPDQFFVLGGFVGLMMGGIQSLSRSTYSKLLPKDVKDTASFFSFYDVTEKLAITIGAFCYGYIADLTGSMRMSALILGIFFVFGLVVLLMTKLPFIKKGQEE